MHYTPATAFGLNTDVTAVKKLCNPAELSAEYSDSELMGLALIGRHYFALQRRAAEDSWEKLPGVCEDDWDTRMVALAVIEVVLGAMYKFDENIG